MPMHEIINVGGTLAAKSVTQAVLHTKMPIVQPKKMAAASLEMFAGQQMENTVGHQEQMPFTNIEQSLKTHKDVACDLPETFLQDTVRACDSMSNLSKRSRGSSTASSRLRAEADMAALIAQQKRMQDKHELEEQMEQLSLQNDKLRRKMEQLELETSMAANAAKI